MHDEHVRLSWILVLVFACSWPCSVVSSTRAHPCCWVCSFVIHHVVLVSSVTTLPFELCPLPGVAACGCVILASRAPNSHQTVQCEASVSPRSWLSRRATLSSTCRPTCSTPHALSRASPELCWPPYPRHGRGFRRAACGPLFAGASASKVCIANGDLHLSSGFALLCLPGSSAVVRRVLLRSPGSFAEAQTLRLSAAVAAAVGFVPHGQWALLDADMLALIDWRVCPVEPIFSPSPRSGHDFPSFPFAGHSSRPGSGRSFVRPFRELLLSPRCDCLSAQRLCPVSSLMRD